VKLDSFDEQIHLSLALHVLGYYRKRNGTRGEFLFYSGRKSTGNLREIGFYVL